MKLSDYKMMISFNLRISYHEMLKCRKFIEELGGYGDFYPGGSSYYGSEENILKLIDFMNDNNIDTESLSINKGAREVTKEKLESFKKSIKGNKK